MGRKTNNLKQMTKVLQDDPGGVFKQYIERYPKYKVDYYYEKGSTSYPMTKQTAFALKRKKGIKFR